MYTRNLVKKLKLAIEKNNIDEVREILLKNPGMANSPSSGTDRSLFWQAMLQGREEIVELFIDLGADVNETCKILKLIILKKTSIVGLSFLQYLVFTKISWRKRVKVAEILMKRGAEIHSVCNPLSLNVLQSAILRGNVEYVKFLLNSGARLDGPEWDRNEPMDLVLRAPRIKQKEILLLLIQHGLNVNSLSKNGNNYLLLTLIKAISFDVDVAEIAKILLDNGVPIDGLGNHGRSAFFLAIQLQNMELMSVLVEKGANVNLKTEDGKEIFPLYQAIFSNNVELIDFIISSGAEVNAKTAQGFTALHLACNRNQEKIISLLLKKGAYISAESNHGRTPFLYLKPQEYKESNVLSIFIMVKEMAKQKFNNNLAVSQKDIDLIQMHQAVQELFQNCTEELFKMSRTKFYACFTYYSVMDMSKKNVKKLAKLTKNDKLVSNFEENVHQFSHYENDLRTMLEEAIQVKERSLIVETRLKHALCGSFPDVVVRKLADNLTTADLPFES